MYSFRDWGFLVSLGSVRQVVAKYAWEVRFPACNLLEWYTCWGVGGRRWGRFFGWLGRGCVIRRFCLDFVRLSQFHSCRGYPYTGEVNVGDVLFAERFDRYRFCVTDVH